MKKKTLFIALIVAMILAMMTGMVWAEGEHPETGHDDWTGVSELPSEPGSYYLTGNVTLNATWTVPVGTTNLCLNGYVIKANTSDTNKFSVITVTEGATLNLYDCETRAEQDRTHAGYIDAAGLWHLAAEGHPATGETSKIITGGIITGGNTSSSGGGVNVAEGTFNMFGGNIVGNKASGNGGGVNVDSGTFTMNKGSIVSNTAISHGGGIFVGGGATVSILDGTIEENSASASGGAAHVDGRFTMSGGTIQKNHASNDGGGLSVNGTVMLTGAAKILNNSASANGSGGAVNYYGGSMTLGGSVQIKSNVKGGTISNGELTGGIANNVCLFNATYKIALGTGTGEGGNGVDAPTEGMSVGVTMANPGVFTTNGGEYAQYFSSDNSAYVAVKSENKVMLEAVEDNKYAVNVNTGIQYETVQAAINTASAGNTIKMLKDKTESINISNTITLDLNGQVLRALSDSVVKINTDGNLTLTDTNKQAVHVGYLDADGLWHWDVDGEHQLEDKETAETIYGGIITGGNALTGGGINNSGTLTMNGGTICGNTGASGGGIFASTYSVNILTGGTVTGNTATNGGGLYQSNEQCFAAGTLITLNDGSQKPIEELELDDTVRVFDHDLGDISSAKLFDLWKYPEKQSGAVTLHFTNNDLTIVYGHSFFEREQNKYVTITKDNVSNFIGQDFYNVDNESWEKLEGYDLVDGKVDAYIISTEYHLNCIANGMLSVEDGIYTTLSNVFEYGDGLKIDAEGKAADLAKFGLYDFEKIKYVSKHVYDVLNLQYLEVAFGKGLITEKQFDYLAAYYVAMDPEFYCGTEEKEPEKKPTLLMMPLMALLSEGHVDPPTKPGVYVGGSVKITENKGGNVYLSSGKLITIGTGTSGNGNGVAAPVTTGENRMSVGVTLADGIGKFTADGNGTADQAKCFFSDKPDYVVKYNNKDTTETTDDYLELVQAYTVTFNLNDHGGDTPPVAQKIEKDGKVTKPEDPIAVGYIFGGWYKEAACTNEWNFDTDTVTADTTLYAKWTRRSSGGHSTPKPVVPEFKNQFVDVFKKEYFYDPVMWAAENKITAGTDATHFSPSGTTTRGQMITFLWRMAGSPVFEDDGTKFTDIKKSDYFYDAVVWGWNIGVINGKTEEAFAPEDNVTRGEAVSFIYRYAKVAGGDLPNPFDDIKQGKFYYYPVLWAANNEITKGTSATMFDPENNCTRGQIVTFLYRFDLKN